MSAPVRLDASDVFNQSPPYEDVDLYGSDQPLREALAANGAAGDADALSALRLCRAVDRSGSDPLEAARARLLIPAAKYFVCKAAPGFIYEALECLGGNGYVEEGMLARLYREAPLNAIWEGSGNVMCLDVLRALAREGEAARSVISDLAEAAADLPGTREATSLLIDTLKRAETEAIARGAVERLALLAAAAALNEWAPTSAEPFARVRLSEPHGSTYGSAGLTDAETRRLLERALPAA